jgi:GGDEF domain-containing protein
MTSVVRTSDPVFRLGGDEFVILLRADVAMYAHKRATKAA